jgi:hypothetical protein
VNEFEGIIDIIDAELMRRHHETAREFFKAGQRSENKRAIQMLEAQVNILSDESGLDSGVVSGVMLALGLLRGMSNEQVD